MRSLLVFPQLPDGIEQSSACWLMLSLVHRHSYIWVLTNPWVP